MKTTKGYEMNLSVSEFDVMALERKLESRKECRGCYQVLPTASFTKNSKSADGYARCCKKCNQDSKMRSRYGLTMTDKFRLYAEQNGRCAICKRSVDFDGKQTHIDHDHVSGKVRGLLCSDCNTSLGKLGDNAELLARAVKYALQTEPEALKQVLKTLLE